MSSFPLLRLRRLRRTESLRRLVQETHVRVEDLVYPLFIVEGNGQKQEIATMPGIFRYTRDMLPVEIEQVAKVGISAVILFGIPDHKDQTGSSAFHPEGVVQQAIRTIKQSFPELVIITDVCLCEYTSHGHCGVIANGYVDNDQTLKLLSATALSHAEAGADIVAPSDMMDGRVKAIRESLDDGGFNHIPIREALREVEQDIAEGADMVMVKPALAYLDVLYRVRQTFNCPLAAYNVSGEFAMVKAAAQHGWIDERQTVLEILTAIKRAGADIIITYHAKAAASWL
jgi:porphobilinogen synthase